MNKPQSNRVMRALVVKDIQLNLGPVLLYLLVALASLWLLTLPHKFAFYGGSVLMLSMLLIASAHLVLNTVTTERNEQNLPFILSLPITFMQYTHAKIMANLLVFGGFWVVVLGGLYLVIFSQAEIPNGLAVYATILLLELLVVFVLLLAVGLITESQIWATVVMTITNICLSLFMMWLSGLAGIQPYIEAPAPVWNQTAWQLVGGAVAIIVLCLTLTYWLQSRKRDYL